MLKALEPIDGSANSLGAVRHIIKLVKDREPLEIHLLNVQPPMHGDVTMFISGSGKVKRLPTDSCGNNCVTSSMLKSLCSLPFVLMVRVNH